ncbi:hypothetical protein K435DRAFT_800406 [Dendrothele bispora CBS 962.96]|uniref:Uncharacterized protein n=1 Tax=Dendrothele bispora (strain CBS 962.96) TaxID=1314807 RepID=A0A4S8LSR7_DENBC|nr:hypothetical protein K435DRAFT_800406 [Dendrothele bispora CBS 962.96]
MNNHKTTSQDPAHIKAHSWSSFRKIQKSVQGDENIEMRSSDQEGSDEESDEGGDGGGDEEADASDDNDAFVEEVTNMDPVEKALGSLMQEFGVHKEEDLFQFVQIPEEVAMEERQKTCLYLDWKLAKWAISEQ